MNQTITLKRDKETKNKIRFSNDATEAISGSLYVAKELIGDQQSITVSFQITALAPAAA